VNEFVFVVKVSKFCNLRCAYCYEHRELHVRDRMNFETLRALFSGIDAFGDYLRGQGIPPKFSFVWHGGEPLLLPPDFYRGMAALQNEHIREYPYRNSVQTNLYGINAATLAFVLNAKWELGVSIDFASDVRRNVGARDSNARVIAAAEALHRSGATFGVLSVLGAHNRESLAEAYDWVAQHADGWRILPVFDGGPEPNIARLQLPEDEVVSVLLDIFRRRAESNRHIPVAPLDDYIKPATLRILGERSDIDPARILLDNIFIVNVNGDIYTRPFAYDAAHCLGNINAAAMPELLRTAAYTACQRTIAHRKHENCLACDYAGYCDSSPMHEHGSVAREGDEERCVVPRRTMAAIEAELASAGVDRAVIAGWAREWLAGYAA
jgi:uncharacterized protein